MPANRARIVSQNKRVRLYYLGGLPERGDGKVTPITSRQRVVNVPKEGEYIEVDMFTAKDLMRRHKRSDKTGTYPAFTTDKRLADIIKKGGTLDPSYFGPQKPVEITAEVLMQKFTAEQLMEIAAQMAAGSGSTIVVNDDDEEYEYEPDDEDGEPVEMDLPPDAGIFEDEDVEEMPAIVQKPKKKSPGRPRKVKDNGNE